MIKNIVFDLGGVLLNIDYRKTAQSFHELGVADFDKHFSQIHSDPLFTKLETGAVIDSRFYDGIREASSITASNDTIDAAWNAMLLDFPEERLIKLRELASSYRLFLFSNTNAIHLRAFSAMFQERYGITLDSLFEKAWYSHLIGHRKPSRASFDYILNDAGLAAHETVFIDDTLQNVDAANAIGIRGIHLTPGRSVIEILDELQENK